MSRQIIKKLKEREKDRIRRTWSKPPEHLFLTLNPVTGMAWCSKCNLLKQGEHYFQNAPSGTIHYLSDLKPLAFVPTCVVNRTRDEHRFPDSPPAAVEVLKAFPQDFLEDLKYGSDQDGPWSAGNYLAWVLDRDEDDWDVQYAPPAADEDKHDVDENGPERWTRACSDPVDDVTRCDCSWRDNELARRLLAAGVFPDDTAEK